MKIYVTGVIFFNGCNEPVKRAFAPYGRDDEALPEGIPPHEASLWIAADKVVEGTESEWWPNTEDAVRSHDIEGVPVLEFRIMDRARLSFPDLNDEPTCDALDKKLPKLKKKKKNKNKPATIDDFEVGPDPDTIAEVTIRGGHIEARQFEEKEKKRKEKAIGLVQWTIPNPSGLLQITATLQNDDSVVAGIITLNDPEAEIVFANTHNLFAGEAGQEDPLRGDDHVVLFQKLNPEADVSVFSEKAKNKALPLITENALFGHMGGIDYTCGETPPCCPN